ncbi:MAG: hypothetical protein WAL56_25295 [Candidatus Sulfotelmatobacter sp.]
MADSGKLDATMYLAVGEEAAPDARCEIKLTPPDGPEHIPALERQSASIRVSEFRGVVQDDSGQ